MIKILCGGLIGFFSAVFLSNYQSCRDSQKLARILLIEVHHNYRVSAQLAEAAQAHFGAKTEAEIQKLKEPQSTNPSLQLIGLLDFRRTVFDATVRDHGILPEKLLGDLHDFYWELTKTERVRQIAEKGTGNRGAAVRYLRSFYHHSVAVIEMVRRVDLLATLQLQADRGWTHCLGPSFTRD
jgi:hypothetical protein